MIDSVITIKVLSTAVLLILTERTSCESGNVNCLVVRCHLLCLSMLYIQRPHLSRARSFSLLSAVLKVLSSFSLLNVSEEFFCI